MQNHMNCLTFLHKNKLINIMAYGTWRFSMTHSHGISNKPPLELTSIQFLALTPIYLIFSSQQRLGLPRNLPVKISKALLPSSTLAALPAHFNLLDLILWLHQVNGTNYEATHYEASATPYFLPFFGPKYSPQDPVLKYNDG